MQRMGMVIGVIACTLLLGVAIEGPRSSSPVVTGQDAAIEDRVGQLEARVATLEGQVAALVAAPATAAPAAAPAAIFDAHGTGDTQTETFTTTGRVQLCWELSGSSPSEAVGPWASFQISSSTRLRVEASFRQRETN